MEKVTRRTAIAVTAAGLTAVPVVAGAAPVAIPDAELLALESEFYRAHDAWLAIDGKDWEPGGELDKADKAAMVFLRGVMDRMVATRAATPAGLRVKLAVLKCWAEGWEQLSENPTDQAFMESLWTDVNAMAETA